jgi:orotate phosphoribosyltransferase
VNRKIMSMEKSDILEIFKATKALMEGHFVLRSGLRSRQYFQCALALQDMPTVEKLVKSLINCWKPEEFTTVVAPAMGGLVLGQEVARQLKKKFIFVEKEDGCLVLRRGFTIEAGERVLVVEDVVTRGGRVQETLRIIESCGGVVVGVLVLVDRSPGPIDLGGVAMTSLLKMDVEVFSEDDLPADLKALPPVKPGSR